VVIVTNAPNAIRAPVVDHKSPDGAVSPVQLKADSAATGGIPAECSRR
jgi:hypothetical protein